MVLLSCLGMKLSLDSVSSSQSQYYHRPLLDYCPYACCIANAACSTRIFTSIQSPPFPCHDLTRKNCEHDK